ncbi:hypothetical protein, partial [Pedobacter chitinilyticus]|uniref:hypothetical protein n=1 Tax=Pedobacter chitinilyticus TaxID=2233776 RepID=UPI0019697802
KYTYYNEKDIDKDGNITGPGTVINVVGDVQNNFQEIVNNTEVKNIFETIVKNTGGNVSYNTSTNSFTYVDGTGTTQTINITDMVKGNETVTKVVAEVVNGKNTGKYTYYNEKDIDKDGNITGPGTVINVVGDVQNNFQDIVNNTEVKNIFETIVKNTGGNVSYNATTNSFTYVDGTGTTQTINITDMVKGNETVTKVVAEVVNGKNTGKYTYYNEKDIDKDGNITGPGTVINVVGDVQNNFQDIVNNTEVKNIFETIVKNTGGNVSYDATNKNFTYVDGNGVTQTINITDMVKGNETVTKVVAEVVNGKNTGKYTYYNEKDIDKDGNITGPGTVINVVGDVQNNFQDIVNNTEVKNIFETIVKNTGGNVSYDATNKNFTYVDGNGVTQTINITDMVQNNQKTSSVTGTGLANVTSSTTGKNTNYTVDVTATAVQGVQKTSSVTKGDYTTVATTTPTTNNTDYKVDVDPSTLIGAGLKLNATTKKIDVDVTTIPNATDKTATVANGTNTTVATDLTNPNNPIYKVDVNNATANAAGAVKPGSGLAVAADGT